MDAPIVRNGPIPVYRQIRDLLHKQIMDGTYGQHAPIPDECSLAKQLGFSRMTVRRAIVQLTREGLLTRVRGKGTFVKGAKRVPFRSGHVSLIGIVTQYEMTSNSSVFRYRIINGILQSAEKGGFALAFRGAFEPAESFAMSLKTDTAIRGVILQEVWNTALLRALEKLPFPTVLVDSVQPDENAPTFDEVTHESRTAVSSAVNSLLRLGHRDIALMLSNKTLSLHRQRLEGYEAALRANQIAPRADRVLVFSASGETAYGLMRNLLKEPNPPTALVVAASEEVTLGAMAAIGAHGWSIPRDISLVAYGDTLPFTVPPVSTIRVPWERIGAAAVQVLEDRVRNPKAPLIRVSFPCEFIQRGSCDVPGNASAARSTQL